MARDSAHLLVISEDTSLIRLLLSGLDATRYQLDYASNGTDGLSKLYALHPDLVALDATLPKHGAWKACRRIRAMCAVPIIMICGEKGPYERIRAFRAGADDCMSRPIGVRELSARIDALLRRVKGGSQACRTAVYEHSDLSIDTTSLQVRRGGKNIPLTATELRLLLLLLERDGRPLSHEEVLTELRGEDSEAAPQATKTYIYRLRSKIEPNPANPRYLLTERGIGYRLVLG